MKGYRCLITLATGLFAWSTASADHYGDLLLFPELTQIGRFDLKDDSRLPEQRINPGLNLFYSYDQDRLRFLLEWLVDRSAQEIQRLQLGWRWQDTTFWLGRTHNPIGYWNTRFHHGAYLMTSISRPGMMTYENSGGPLPLHVTGLYLEGSRELGESSLYYVLNAGVGPDLSERRLDAFDILDPEGDRRPAVTLRLGYQPTAFASDEFGFSFSYTEIPGQAIGVQRVDQMVANAYATWRWDDFNFLTEAIFVHNDYQGAQAQSNIGNVYGQGEWKATPDLTVYSRVEGSFNDAGDRYFDHFGSFVRERYLGGLRYELPYKMALKFELARERVRDDHYGQLGLQWSAVFP
ncbi:hypothetical protein [Methylococcus sp. EFPC2]|uniref:hypothetical protein n=1 Tax=Methylococcus sp. EFPC2 TaxID=2812648 RepID=UPI001966E24D|nr:hypothetical protein [Methylococcus sp. EFPC2]QSA97916.1 hypothetical protein JWZ97_03550 [Methylococcus sp. EFPC2]